jgi:hypothetical protein
VSGYQPGSWPALQRFAQRLDQAGFDEAMKTALRAEDVLCADETPTNVIGTDTGAHGKPVAGSPHAVTVRTPHLDVLIGERVLQIPAQRHHDHIRWEPELHEPGLLWAYSTKATTHPPTLPEPLIRQRNRRCSTGSQPFDFSSVVGVAILQARFAPHHTPTPESLSP